MPVCAKCNSTFGHTFEAATSKHFLQWMFMFRRCGMKPPYPVVWKNLVLDNTDRRHDVDQDLNAALSKPEVLRDSSGRFSRAVGDKKLIARMVKSLHGHGARTRSTPDESRIDVRTLQLRQPLDDDVKRLCVKMSIGLARRFGTPISLSSSATSYLIEARVAEACPVRIALNPYEELVNLRPRLGHLVFLRASSAERRVYSVVQFFGVMQFYCELNGKWLGDDYAILATHDPIKHEENIRTVSPLNYAIPSRFIDSADYSEMWRDRLERLRLELVALFGDQAPTNIK